MSPLKKPDVTILDDTDLAGPIVFAVLMGTFLLLTGKVRAISSKGLGHLIIHDWLY